MQIITNPHELFYLLEAKQIREKLTDSQVSRGSGINRTTLFFMKKRRDGRKELLDRLALYLKVVYVGGVPKKDIKPEPKKLSEEEQTELKENKRQRKLKAKQVIDDHHERQRLNKELGFYELN